MQNEAKVAIITGGTVGQRLFISPFPPCFMPTVSQS